MHCSVLQLITTVRKGFFPVNWILENVEDILLPHMWTFSICPRLTWKAVWFVNQHYIPYSSGSSILEEWKLYIYKLKLHWIEIHFNFMICKLKQTLALSLVCHHLFLIKCCRQKRSRKKKWIPPIDLRKIPQSCLLTKTPGSYIFNIWLDILHIDVSGSTWSHQDLPCQILPSWACSSYWIPSLD